MRILSIRSCIYCCVLLYIIIAFITVFNTLTKDAVHILNMGYNMPLTRYTNQWNADEGPKGDYIHKLNADEGPKGDYIHNSDKSPISIKEYSRFYKLDNKVHEPCVNITRHKMESIRWRKHTYQQFQVKFPNLPERDAFIMKFYFDDRFPGERIIRAVFTIHGLGFLTKVPNKTEPVWQLAFALYNSPWWVLLWYQHFEEPILVKCRLVNSGGLDRKVGGTVFSQHIITCVLPEIDKLPQQASIISHPDNTPDNLIDIVYPKVPSEPPNWNIGICMASLYGSLGDPDVYYFINWMETLHLLGVSEVTVNNASLHINGSGMVQAIDYYRSIGRLSITHYPPVHYNWTSPKEDDAATEAINKITTSDCYYRNLKKYWYTLIIDMDEIPVPSKHLTYQQFLLDYFTKYPNATQAHSLGVRSAFFYLDFPSGNAEYGDHLPVLQKSRRFRMEPMEVDGAGLSKSFHNNRIVVASGHHQARQGHPPRSPILHQYLDPDDILIHHYRKICKYSAYCKEHWNETLHDDVLPRRFGSTIKQRVKNILQNIGLDNLL